MGQPAFKDGDGDGGGFDPRDFAIAALEHENDELRAVLRRLLDSEGEEAGEAIEVAERLLEAHDTIEAEDEAERAMIAYDSNPVCDCGTWKGAGNPYCPECDADALESIRERAGEPTNVVMISRITLPF